MIKVRSGKVTHDVYNIWVTFDSAKQQALTHWVIVSIKKSSRASRA